jgi:oligosaccharide repeat unit polymerase
LYKSYNLGKDGPFDDFFTNLRFSLTKDDNPESYGILSYAIVLSFISTGLHLFLILQNASKLRFFITLLVSLTYTVFFTGRTMFFLLFIMLIGILLATRRVSCTKGISYLVFIGTIVFSAVGILLGKGLSFQASIVENLTNLWDVFIIYLLGSLPAFDIYIQSKESFDYGRNMFRTLFAFFNKIGFETRVPLLIKEYQYIPFPTNVYTIYQPYFDDFSIIGAVSIQFFLGLLHGFFYRKIDKGKPIYIMLYAIFLYPLLMQFLQDQYFNLLSTWIQYFILLYIYFYTPRFITR